MPSVEEYHEGRPPVSSHGHRGLPPARALQLVCCKIECVDLGLGQVVSSRYIPLWSRLRKPRQRVNQILLPGPRDNRSQVFARLVRMCPGFVPSSAIARSYTQSRNSRISLRPSRSMGTPPPHDFHFASVVRYSACVPGAELWERKYF